MEKFLNFRFVDWYKFCMGIIEELVIRFYIVVFDEEDRLMFLFVFYCFKILL